MRSGGKVAGVVLDEGIWRDIGNIADYMRVHADLASGAVQLVPPATVPSGWPLWRMPGAEVSSGASMNGWNWCGPDSHVGAGAQVADSILWAGSRVEPGAVVEGSVVREGMIAAGEVKATVV